MTSPLGATVASFVNNARPAHQGGNCTKGVNSFKRNDGKDIIQTSEEKKQTE